MRSGSLICLEYELLLMRFSNVSAYSKTKSKSKICKGRDCENSSPISDTSDSVFRIGNIIFTIKRNFNKTKGKRKNLDI